jgi:IPT/TIG domain
VREAYYAMDSVFLGPAERQTTFLSLPGQPLITLAELLKWVEDFATVEGVQLLQDGGKEGVQVLAFTASRLHTLVKLTQDKSASSSENPTRAFHTARTQRALEEIRVNLETVQKEAEEIRRPDETLTNFPEIQSVSPKSVALAKPPDYITIKGSNLLGGSNQSEVKVTLIFISETQPQIVVDIPGVEASSSDSQVTFKFSAWDPKKTGDWALILENASGEDSLDPAITVTNATGGYSHKAECVPDAAETHISDEHIKELANSIWRIREAHHLPGDARGDWLEAKQILTKLYQKTRY